MLKSTLTFLILLMAGACTTSGVIMKARDFQVHGHRGARAVRQENTLSAFRYALAEGVDALELDLNVTKDDVLVVTHGFRIDSAQAPLVRSLTLKQLKKYDSGAKVIPTFEEVLQWLAEESNPRAKTVLLNVELKSDPEHPEYSPDPKNFVKMTIDLAKKYGIFSRVILQSFDFRNLTEARQLESGSVTSALISIRPTTTLAEVAFRLKVDIISPRYEWVTRHDVDSLHALGVKVIPWTANTLASWDYLVGINVDGIITDDPKGLLDFRRSLKH